MINRGGYFVYVICAAVFLTFSKQHVVDVLVEARLCTCSVTASISPNPQRTNIGYITMPIRELS